MKEYIRESIEKQIDDNLWVSYYYSSADGDTFSSFTYFEGDIQTPEYSKEILHTLGEKRYKESEIVPFCKEALKTFEEIVLKDK